MRLIVTVVLAIGTTLLFAIAGAAAGGYVGFHLIGVPSGPHCGLGVLPAIFLGGLPGIFLGLVAGTSIGSFLTASLLALVIPLEDAGKEDE
jgi:hypothetical protein